MNRPIPVLAVVSAFVLSACGGTASGAATTSPSPRGNAFNGASGQLVQINGSTLILTGPNGDTTVTFTTTTTFTKTSIATLADVVSGVCVFATGQKDAAGSVTATTVLVSPKTASGCSVRGFGGPGGSPPPGASPRPNPTARPSGANAAFVTGEVTAVSGPIITVKTAADGSQTITVASAATITDSATVTASALQDGECVRANGPKDSAGDVQATAITITPAGPSGTCTTGPGGRGGGGFPGGGGNGG